MRLGNRLGLALLAWPAVVWLGAGAGAARAQDDAANAQGEAAAGAETGDGERGSRAERRANRRARAAADAEAAAADLDRTPRDCIPLPSVRSTEVLDDHTILFFMRGNQVAYRNYLPRECPNLDRENRFAYSTTTPRLCSTDLITVLEEFGLELRGTFTCRLGQFTPITVEDARALLDDKAGKSPRRAIEAKPAELPPDGDAAADEGGAPDGADAATGAPAPPVEPQ